MTWITSVDFWWNFNTQFARKLKNICIACIYAYIWEQYFQAQRHVWMIIVSVRRKNGIVREKKKEDNRHRRASMENGARNQQPLRCVRQKFICFVQPIFFFCSSVSVCLFHVQCARICSIRLFYSLPHACISIQSDPHILPATSSVKWNSITIVGTHWRSTPPSPPPPTAAVVVAKRAHAWIRSNSIWLRCKTIDLNRNSTCWNIKQNGNKETNEQTNEQKKCNTHTHTHGCKSCSQTMQIRYIHWIQPEPMSLAASHKRYCTLQFTFCIFRYTE